MFPVQLALAGDGPFGNPTGDSFYPLVYVEFKPSKGVAASRTKSVVKGVFVSKAENTGL